MTGSSEPTYYLKIWVRKMNRRRLATWISRCKKPWLRPMSIHGTSSKPASTCTLKERTGRYRLKSERGKYLTLISRMSTSMRARMISAAWEARSNSKTPMLAISTDCSRRGRASWITLRDSKHPSITCRQTFASLTCKFKQTLMSLQDKFRKT